MIGSVEGVTRVREVGGYTVMEEVIEVGVIRQEWVLDGWVMVGRGYIVIVEVIEVGVVSQEWVFCICWIG